VRQAGLQTPGDPELLQSSRPRSAAEQIHERRGEETRILRGGFRTGHPHPSGGQAQNQRLVGCSKSGAGGGGWLWVNTGMAISAGLLR